MIETHFVQGSAKEPYKVQRDPATGDTSCSCPAWRNKKLGQARGCKHIDKVFGGDKAAAQAPKPITAGPPRISPMLASAMPETASMTDYVGDDFVLEEKYDGHRVMVRVDEKGVAAWSRPQRGQEPLSRELPSHIVQALTRMAYGVFDGELMSPGGMHSDVVALENKSKLYLILFDIVEAAGTPCMSMPYRQRRQFLEVAASKAEGDVVRLANYENVSLEAVKRIWARGGEGAILKRVESTYRPGCRSDDWIKVKKQQAAEMTIVGFAAGKSGPHSVTLLKSDDGVDVKVKTLDNATLRDIAKDPDAWIGRRLVISYTERRKSGKYQNPMFDHVIGKKGRKK